MDEPCFGVYRARIEDNADPTGRLRLLVSAPQLDEAPLGWAEACVCPTIDASTIDAVPAIGAMVWIMFESGDVGRPVWLGTLPEPAS